MAKTASDTCAHGLKPKRCFCHVSTSFCYVKNEKRLRSRTRPKVTKVDEVFDERGVLKGEFHLTDVEDKLAKRFVRSAEAALQVNGDYKTPRIAKLAWKLRPTYNQLVHKYPWAVVWFSMKDGKRHRHYRKFTSVGAAVAFHARILPARPTATVISRTRGYYIPTSLIGNIPKPWKWCPYCCKPRKYRRLPTGETFYAIVKSWSEEKQRYVPKDRQLAVTRCEWCRSTNKDPVFRKSNQPWEVRKIKKGVRRIKKRKTYKRRKKDR